MILKVWITLCKAHYLWPKEVRAVAQDKVQTIVEDIEVATKVVVDNVDKAIHHMVEDSQTKIIIEQIVDKEIEVKVAAKEDLNKVLNLKAVL